MQIGKGYIGTSDITTSKSNEELIVKPDGYTVYNAYKAVLKNYDPCHIIINGETRIYLDELDCFQMDINDAPLFSLKIEEPNVKYTFIGAIK